MIRYYCSGFDVENSFGHGLGEKFKSELKKTDSIVYIPGGPKKVEKSIKKYLPLFRKHFATCQIHFETENLITPDTPSAMAQNMVKNADFVMLMGGDPIMQKDMCEKLGIMDALKNYNNGIMLGYSAGAMLMSKYIIITPGCEEHPDPKSKDSFVTTGLNLDGLSIYPHNNTADIEYPDVLDLDGEVYRKSDLIQVAKDYGEYYLLQDNKRETGKVDVSLIKSIDGKITTYIENAGKIWVVGSGGIKLYNNSITPIMKKDREY